MPGRRWSDGSTMARDEPLLGIAIGLVFGTAFAGARSTRPGDGTEAPDERPGS